MEGELLDFIDWYNIMYEDVRGLQSEEIVNMYLYYKNNKL